jgi:hypothetical protein
MWLMYIYSKMQNMKQLDIHDFHDFIINAQVN